MESKLKDLSRGAIFSLAGIEWVILDDKASKGKAFQCESIKNTFYSPFDRAGKNDWKSSYLRERLNGEFLDELEMERPGIQGEIVPMIRDLIAEDGIDDYGACVDLVSILSADEYRQTRDLHPGPEKWCWLITPDGTEESSGSSKVRAVQFDGSLISNRAYRGDGGVRPVILFKPDIMVTIGEIPENVDDEEQFQKFEMMLYESAVETWGPEKQVIEAAEKMRALADALMELIAFKDSCRGDYGLIADRISTARADADIALNQLHVIFGDNTEKEMEQLQNLCNRLFSRPGMPYIRI